MISRDEISLAFAQSQSLNEIEKKYREISKLTHPDLVGGADDLFKFLQIVYQSSLARLETERSDLTHIESKAKEVLSELGVSDFSNLRLCSYVILYRIFSAGLLHRKIRMQEGLKKRNEVLIQVFNYIVKKYDVLLAEYMELLLGDSSMGLQPTNYLHAKRDLRRKLEEGLSQFMRYMEESRPISKRLARSSLESVVDIISVYKFDALGELKIAQWLLLELEKGPVV